jgi:hypothetical protein
MKRHLVILFIFLLPVLLTASCRGPEKYSEIPAIKFESLTVQDTLDELENPVKHCVLVFSFVDGDGDLGLDPEDTLPPYEASGNYYYNLFIDTYKKSNGQFNKVGLETPLYFRFPDVSATGQNKTLKGSVLTWFNYYMGADTIFNFGDTLRYTFFIYDRALHRSNTETTSEIILFQ